MPGKSSVAGVAEAHKLSVERIAAWRIAKGNRGLSLERK